MNDNHLIFNAASKAKKYLEKITSSKHKPFNNGRKTPPNMFLSHVLQIMKAIVPDNVMHIMQQV